MAPTKWKIVGGTAAAALAVGGTGTAGAIALNDSQPVTEIEPAVVDVPFITTSDAPITDIAELINVDGVDVTFDGMNGQADDSVSSPFDSPDSPDSVDSPDSPDSPDSVDSPDSPDSPSSVDSPDSLDSPSSVDSPDSLDSPSSVDSPDSPDSPDSVDSPDSPSSVDTP